MQHKQKGSTIGVNLILVVFILLCLITFGTLSYLLAKVDNNLSISVAQNTAAYYKAECLAQERLQEIDTLLCDAYAEADTQYAYVSALQSQDLLQKNIVVQYNNGALTLVMETAVDDNEKLVSTLALPYPVTDTYYTVESWVLQSASET